MAFRTSAIVVACLVLLCSLVITGSSVHRRRHHTTRNNYDSQIVDDESTEEDKSPFSAFVSPDSWSKYYVEKHELYDEIKLKSCYDTDCPNGQECKIDRFGERFCECAAPEYCTPGAHLVCGSDGMFYTSHCELHRTACMNKKMIRVVKDTSQCIIKKEFIPALPKLEHVESIKKDLEFQYKTDSSAKPTVSPSCDKETFLEFRRMVLLFHCNRVGLFNCASKVKNMTQPDVLMVAMFEYYDKNGDEQLTNEELSYSQNADHLETLAHGCSLSDLLVRSGVAALDRKNFWRMFDAVYMGESSQKYAPLQEKITLSTSMKIRVVADGIRGITLNCSLPQVTEIGWLRNGANITGNDEFAILPFGHLTISAVNMRHAGNYSCFDKVHPDTTQEMSLTVLVKPVVITQKVGSVGAGVTTSLRCHATGVPEPQVNWHVGQYMLPNDHKRYFYTNENTSVSIHSPNVSKDSGTYHCIAKSEAGWSQAETEVKVKEDVEEDSATGEYIVFHDTGYSVFDASHCYTTHSIEKTSADFILRLSGDVSTVSQMCIQSEPCVWGSAVNVANKFIYVSQPSLKRILIIDIQHNYRPVQVVPMFKSPVSLHYMASVDEVWLLCGQIDFQQVFVLRDASINEDHTLESFLPYSSIFDSVSQVFVPPTTNPYNAMMRYAYTNHFIQEGLNRIDIVTMEQDDTMDLSTWQCVPDKLSFLTIGGLAVVQCQVGEETASSVWEAKLLLVDTVTNSVIHPLGQGVVYSSPDSRHLVTQINKDHLRVHHITEDGTILFMYDQWTRMDIGHVTFMPSKASRGYDVAVLSKDSNSMEFMDIKTRKVEMLEGLLTGREDTVPTPESADLLSTSGQFGEDVFVPSQGALFIINKHWHRISCEWTDISNATLSLYMSPNL